MNIKRYWGAALSAIALAAFAGGAQAQDIKLGYNGDLSASPSAQSGQAAVIGMEAAIADITAGSGSGCRSASNAGQDFTMIM